MNGVLGKMTMAEVTQRAVLGRQRRAAHADRHRRARSTPSSTACAAGCFPSRAITESVRKLLVAKQEMGLARQRFTDVQALRTGRRRQRESRGRAAGRRARHHAREGLARPRALRRAAAHRSRRQRDDRATHRPRRRRDVQRGARTRCFPHCAPSRSPRSRCSTPPGRSGGTRRLARRHVPREPAAARSCPHSSRTRCAARRARIVVIVSSYFGASSSTSRLAAPEGMADLLNGLQKAGTRVVLATFSNPYIAQDLPPTPRVPRRLGQLAARAARRGARAARPGADQRSASDHHSVSRAVRCWTATRRVAADIASAAPPRRSACARGDRVDAGAVSCARRDERRVIAAQRTRHRPLRPLTASLASGISRITRRDEFRTELLPIRSPTDSALLTLVTLCY